MAILTVSNLTKKFKDFLAVDDISFSLKEGEILGLLGPNGAGKTTTIQMLLGILTPTAGVIKYFGKDLAKHREEILEQINFSSTYTSLPWNLKVIENLRYISYLYSINNRNERIKKIIEIFKLEEMQNKFISELSAGQKTRVNLAKAFINFPTILLLDEPTASLDPDIAQYIRDFLKSEREKFQVAILFTSHNMSEVEEICDRVIFINQGKIVADDTPDNLAKTIQVCHIELLIDRKLDKFLNYLQHKNISFSKNGKRVTVNIEEKDLANLLQDLTNKEFSYNEISIEKPTLEDYFLSLTKKRN